MKKILALFLSLVCVFAASACAKQEKEVVANEDADRAYDYVQSFSQEGAEHPMTEIHNYGSHLSTGNDTAFDIIRSEYRGDYDTPYYSYAVRAFYNNSAFYYGGEYTQIGIRVAYIFTDEKAKEISSYSKTGWSISFNLGTITEYNVGVNKHEIKLDETNYVEEITFDTTFHLGNGTDEELKRELKKGAKEAIDKYRDYCKLNGLNLPL